MPFLTSASGDGAALAGPEEVQTRPSKPRGAARRSAALPLCPGLRASEQRGLPARREAACRAPRPPSPAIARAAQQAARARPSHAPFCCALSACHEIALSALEAFTDVEALELRPSQTLPKQSPRVGPCGLWSTRLTASRACTSASSSAVGSHSFSESSSALFCPAFVQHTGRWNG